MADDISNWVNRAKMQSLTMTIVLPYQSLLNFILSICGFACSRRSWRRMTSASASVHSAHPRDSPNLQD